MRAYVLRFALELGHRSMQPVLRICAKNHFGCRLVLRYEQQSCSNRQQIVSREYYPSATNTYLLPSLASVPTFGINQ